MQLPGLLGFPRGEEQAPGEQVELREEKGAKSESSPSPGLPYRRESVGPFFNIPVKSMHAYQVLSVSTLLLLSTCLSCSHMFRPLIQDFKHCTCFADGKAKHKDLQ